MVARPNCHGGSGEAKQRQHERGEKVEGSPSKDNTREERKKGQPVPLPFSAEMSLVARRYHRCHHRGIIVVQLGILGQEQFYRWSYPGTWGPPFLSPVATS